MTNTNEEILETTRPFNSTPYSNSELVDLKLSSRSFTKGRRGVSDGQNAITNITIHIVNGDWREGGFTTFAQSQSASSNYGITTSGKIVQLVDEKNTPWTNGVRDGIPLTNPFGEGSVGSSNNSVTIEVSNLRVNEKTGPNTFVATDGKEYNFKVENGQKVRVSKRSGEVISK
jgi:N-acetyl-anhydromuramyl-L-alanine amidase AmpD